MFGGYVLGARMVWRVDRGSNESVGTTSGRRSLRIGRASSEHSLGLLSTATIRNMSIFRRKQDQTLASPHIGQSRRHIPAFPRVLRVQLAAASRRVTPCYAMLRHVTWHDANISRTTDLCCCWELASTPRGSHRLCTLHCDRTARRALLSRTAGGRNCDMRCTLPVCLETRLGTICTRARVFSTARYCLKHDLFHIHRLHRAKALP